MLNNTYELISTPLEVLATWYAFFEVPIFVHWVLWIFVIEPPGDAHVT